MDERPTQIYSSHKIIRGGGEAIPVQFSFKISSGERGSPFRLLLASRWSPPPHDQPCTLKSQRGVAQPRNPTQRSKGRVSSLCPRSCHRPPRFSQPSFAVAVAVAVRAGASAAAAEKLAVQTTPRRLACLPTDRC